jgi:hypothetical protein
MARRRGSRYSRRDHRPGGGRGTHVLSATTLVTVPSGVTVDKQQTTSTMVQTNFIGEHTGNVTGVLHGTIDFGQGTHLKMYRGTSGLTATPSGGGTGLSAGTMQFTTGLTTVSDFVWRMNCSAGSTAHQTARWPQKQTYRKGYINAGGVTVFLYNANGACTRAGSILSGVSISWTAVGV